MSKSLYHLRELQNWLPIINDLEKDETLLREEAINLRVSLLQGTRKSDNKSDFLNLD